MPEELKRLFSVRSIRQQGPSAWLHRRILLPLQRAQVFVGEVLADNREVLGKGSRARGTLELRGVVVIERRPKGIGLFAYACHQIFVLFGADSRGFKLQP